MASDDIFRGPLPPPSVRSLSTDDLSASSSSFFGPRATLGAVAAIVENAITRWARRRAPSSASSSSSSSSRSSIVSASRSAKRSRQSHSSLSRSEMGFTAHLALVKARKEARKVPRQFSLYLSPAHELRYPEDSQSITITDSLSDVLDRLDSALKKPFRPRRAQERPHTVPSQLTPTSLPNDASRWTVNVESSSRFYAIPARTRVKKGKGRATSPTDEKIDTRMKPRRDPWYLDVTSPSWEDLRALGKLLHLHPLTLEDILQQEPREKLELFPKLGYYLISFRAIESRSSRHQTLGEDHDHNPYEEALVGEANVYLAIFKDGICSFHFTDISEHTRRVRNRMNRLGEIFHLSSDWIAYEVLDSIVDSFFPYLDEIDKDIVEIEKLVFSRSGQETSGEGGTLASTATETSNIISEKLEKTSDTETIKEREGDAKAETPNKKVGFLDRVLAVTPFKELGNFDLWRHLRRFKPQLRPVSGDNIMQNSRNTLRRIARVRRLVTSLSRLLATKSDVVARIRKRLVINSQPGTGVGISPKSLEIAMYMGDMQDHIDTLQYSLAYYERMLSHLHPTYLSQLRMDVEITRSGKGTALLSLYTITVAVLCIQTYVGIFSLNVTVPHNTLYPNGSYHLFGVVLGTSIMILIAYGLVVRRWWKRAQLVYRTRL